MREIGEVRCFSERGGFTALHYKMLCPSALVTDHDPDLPNVGSLFLGDTAITGKAKSPR